MSTPTEEPSNGLLCFTNCLLPQEDGSLVEKDLWIDANRGVILDAQVGTLSVDVVARSYSGILETSVFSTSGNKDLRRSLI